MEIEVCNDCGSKRIRHTWAGTMYVGTCMDCRSPDIVHKKI